MQNKNDQSDKGGGGGQSGQSSQMLEVFGSVRVIEVVRVGGVVRFVCNLQNLQQIDPEQQIVKQMSQFANLQNKLFATTICKKVIRNNNLSRLIICKMYQKNQERQFARKVSRMTICNICKKKVVWNNYLMSQFDGENCLELNFAKKLS